MPGAVYICCMNVHLGVMAAAISPFGPSLLRTDCKLGPTEHETGASLVGPHVRHDVVIHECSVHPGGSDDLIHARPAEATALCGCPEPLTCIGRVSSRSGPCCWWIEHICCMG